VAWSKIIVIIHHELGLDRLFRSSLIVSSKVFQVNFSHLVYNTVLFLSFFLDSTLQEKEDFKKTKTFIPITGNIKQN